MAKDTVHRVQISFRVDMVQLQMSLHAELPSTCLQARALAASPYALASWNKPVDT